jgi:hypothetical protein
MPSKSSSDSSSVGSNDKRIHNDKLEDDKLEVENREPPAHEDVDDLIKKTQERERAGKTEHQPPNSNRELPVNEEAGAIPAPPPYDDEPTAVPSTEPDIQHEHETKSLHDRAKAASMPMVEKNESNANRIKNDTEKFEQLFRLMIRSLFKHPHYRLGRNTEELMKVADILYKPETVDGSFILSDGAVPAKGTISNWPKTETLAVLYVKKNKKIIRYDISFDKEGLAVYGDEVDYQKIKFGNFSIDDGFSNLLQHLAKKKIIS